MSHMLLVPAPPQAQLRVQRLGALVEAGNRQGRSGCQAVNSRWAKPRMRNGNKWRSSKNTNPVSGVMVMRAETFQPNGPGTLRRVKRHAKPLTAFSMQNFSFDEDWQWKLGSKDR